MEGSLAQYFSYILSTVTILSCMFLKIPQIVNIVCKQSAKGMYVLAMMMEIIGFTIVTLYNYTNSYGYLTYLEYPIILLQILVMLYYTLKYKGLLCSPLVPIILCPYCLFVALFATGFLNKKLLTYLVPMTAPINGFAKITYIYGMIQSESAQAVSRLTWFISILTNLARLTTIYMDSADTVLMFNLVISTLLSVGVLATATRYKCTCTCRAERNAERDKARQQKQRRKGSFCGRHPRKRDLQHED